MSPKTFIADLRLTAAALRAFIRENRQSCLTAALWAFGVPLLAAFAMYKLTWSGFNDVAGLIVLLTFLALIFFWLFSHLSLFVGMLRFLDDGSRWRFIANLGDRESRPLTLRLIALLAILLVVLLIAPIAHTILSDLTVWLLSDDIWRLWNHHGGPDIADITPFFYYENFRWVVFVPVMTGLLYVVARSAPAIGLLAEPRPLRRAWRLTRAGWICASALIFGTAFGVASILAAVDGVGAALAAPVFRLVGFQGMIVYDTVFQVALAVGGLTSTGMIAAAAAVAGRRLRIASGNAATADTLSSLSVRGPDVSTPSPGSAGGTILPAGPMSAAGDVSRALLIGLPSALLLIPLYKRIPWSLDYVLLRPGPQDWDFVWNEAVRFALSHFDLWSFYLSTHLLAPPMALAATAAAGATLFFAGRHLLFMGRTHPRRIAEIDRNRARLLVRDRFGAPLGRLAFAPDAITGAHAEPGRLVIHATEAREPEILAVSGDPAGAEQAARIRAAAQVSETSWVIRTHGADAARPEYMLARTIETLRADRTPTEQEEAVGS